MAGSADAEVPVNINQTYCGGVAVGAAGVLYQRRAAGGTWENVATGVTTDLRGAWGRSSAEIYAMGSAGVVLQWNGRTWSKLASGTRADLAATSSIAARHPTPAAAEGRAAAARIWRRRDLASRRRSRRRSQKRTIRMNNAPIRAAGALLCVADDRR
jgi:hypothetical protein